ncbi:histidinol-phosphate aminotransferase [Acetitomaculum ruminis DSM 5522]|uniref:Histidinol-phosphate aminotransferase n=1 Tax=Acetitomaculum ruminis DSM 5522 TaxID=1120918 RepID=A0A1I0XPA6_9FIRM|nr:histidinol-phosphate transaminase [Acetitomaculum ruminis]SFB02120.1 histidinol-phosphate aminotransferase [Acetitomaculum ruminis DSM 5522]
MKEFEKNIRKVVPYVPGEQPKIRNIIKLNTNENPYPPSNLVKKAIENFDSDTLKYYPDPTMEKIVAKLADYHKVSKDMVFVGVGSDDVLAMAFMTFFNSQKPLLFPDITYSFYDVWAELFKIYYKRIPLDEEFKIKKEDYYIENGGIIFPNPNAPTGVFESLDTIRNILDNNKDVVVIIDEAYVDFAKESALSLIDEYDNLLVVRTFSKSRSLAGLRLGYAIGNPLLIKYLNDVKYSFNSYTLNALSMEMAAASIDDEEYFKETIKKVINTRENAKKTLSELGFEFADSQSNFIFAKHKSFSASIIFEKLKKNNIFVRYFNKERIDNYLRISIGTDEEMDKFFECLKKIINELD